MKKIFFVSLSLAMNACISEDKDVTPVVIIDPPTYHLIGRDTVGTGEHIGKSHAEYYQTLQARKEVKHLNIVGNRVQNIGELKHRLPLYNYLIFDYANGTDKGVQVYMEKQVVKSIYLNSGKELKSWPEKGNDVIQVGESSASVAEKLIKLQGKNEYAPIFSRTMLMVKDMETSYDEGLNQTDAWFFTRMEGEDLLDEHTIHFLEGKVDHIIVSKMKK
jgi:hypothetical protein